jgi:hypothetical protein
MTSMRKVSVVYAKAHFSKIVHLAEHKAQRVLILRNGNPAAVVGPVDPPAEHGSRMTLRAFDTFLDHMIAGASQTEMTTEKALGRGRLEGSR